MVVFSVFLSVVMEMVEIAEPMGVNELSLSRPIVRQEPSVQPHPLVLGCGGRDPALSQSASSLTADRRRLTPPGQLVVVVVKRPLQERRSRAAHCSSLQGRGGKNGGDRLLVMSLILEGQI